MKRGVEGVASVVCVSGPAGEPVCSTGQERLSVRQSASVPVCLTAWHRLLTNASVLGVCSHVAHVGVRILSLSLSLFSIFLSPSPFPSHVLLFATSLHRLSSYSSSSHLRLFRFSFNFHVLAHVALPTRLCLWLPRLLPPHSFLCQTVA